MEGAEEGRGVLGMLCDLLLVQPLGGSELGSFSSLELGFIGLELGSGLVAFGSGRDECCIGVLEGNSRIVGGGAAILGVAAGGGVGLSRGLGGMEQRPLGIELLLVLRCLPRDGGAPGLLPRELFPFLDKFL